MPPLAAIGQFDDADSEIYAAAIMDGAKRMDDKARFGGLTDSEERTKRCYFNRDHWRRIRDEEYDDDDDEPYKLVLRKRVRPSEALRDMFDNLDQWAFDCAEALQLLQWYARLQLIGDAAFDEWAKKNGGLHLREHDSTGIESSALFIREDEEGDYTQKGPFRQNGKDDSSTLSNASLETLLANAPLGSRIMWRNFDTSVEDDEPFKNENAIKVGPDLYFAHPLGFVTGQELVRGLARQTGELSDTAADAYAAQYIELVEIEYFGADLLSGQ